MELTYEELVKYDIWRAIELKGKDKRKFKTTEELLHANDNDPAKVPNNPLLTNYDWVYENAEKLLYNNIFDYQKFQGIEEYYTLFKAITNKYSLENDYEEYLNGNAHWINMKWGIFALQLIEFISHAFDERLKAIMNKEEVINYFLKYPAIYNHDKIESFNWIGIEKFLTYPYYSDYYIKDYSNLVQLIRNNIKIKIPTELMVNDKIIKSMSRTYHIEAFYFNLYFISEQVSEQPYLDEHKKFCDEEIKKIENGILPCYQKSYKQLPNELSLEDIEHKHNLMETQVIERIFTRSGLTTLPKEYIYQELSKYLIIGMFISRNYETDPFNILIDINTLYNHAKENNRALQGLEIYEFLHNYESKTATEIIDFYNNTKNLPLKEILYDDWENEKNNFVTELNSQMININELQP